MVDFAIHVFASGLLLSGSEHRAKRIPGLFA